MTTTYTITRNEQYNSYEVTFDSKPATAVLDALKALKMRWNHKKGCWYGFADEHKIKDAIINNSENGETVTGEPVEGATVYTDGYLGGGAVYGSKSNRHLYGAELSKAVREDIKKAGFKGVSVRIEKYSMGQHLYITVPLRSDEFVSLPEWIENYRITPGMCWIYTGTDSVHVGRYFEMSAHEQEEIRVAAAEYEYERRTARECDLNVYHLDTWTQFNAEARAKLEKIHGIVNAYRYDDSNAMVDYFDTNFYYDISTKPASK